MGSTVAIFLAGLAVLIAGGEAMVRGATRLAAGSHLSRLFVGLTLVSFSTSAPEFVVSILADLRGAPDIAVGNVIGSNIFNIGVVLALGALVATISLRMQVIWREMTVAVVATLIVGGLAQDGVLGRVEGLFLALGLLVYVLWAYRSMAGGPGAPLGASEGRPKHGQFATSATSADLASLGGRALSLSLMALGLALLIVGARMLVDSSVDLAAEMGMRPAVIGLTIIAAGTSLPELATTMVAAARRESDIAIGNVLGSNIFNLLGILGLAGMLEPLPVAPHLARYDIPIALAFALVLIPLMVSGRRLSRGEGLLLFLGYAGYTVWLVMTRAAAG